MNELTHFHNGLQFGIRPCCITHFVSCSNSMDKSVPEYNDGHKTLWKYGKGKWGNLLCPECLINMLSNELLYVNGFNIENLTDVIQKTPKEFLRLACRANITDSEFIVSSTIYRLSNTSNFFHNNVNIWRIILSN